VYPIDSDILAPGPVDATKDIVGSFLASALIAHQEGKEVQLDITVRGDGHDGNPVAIHFHHRRNVEGRLETTVNYGME